jgi:hypothetical protein
MNALFTNIISHTVGSTRSVSKPFWRRSLIGVILYVLMVGAPVRMAESNNIAKAASHGGARRLIQLMPTTAEWLGVHDSFDPARNIDGSVRYFKILRSR